MKRLLILGAAILLVTSSLSAAVGVSGTKHDLSSSGPGAKTNVARTCVFCHTPHQASTASKQDPLWNHTMSTTATYGVYASDTLDATVSEIGGFTAGAAPVSALCLSCHDGTVSVASMYNTPNEVTSVTLTAGGNVDASGFITGNANLGTDLTNDHPVNFTYDSALVTLDGSGLKTPSSTSWVDAAKTVPLFGGKVQCASCHNPHDSTNTPFLVKANTASALCTTCHNK